MKYIILFLGILLLLTSIVSCQSSAEPTATTPTGTQETTALSEEWTPDGVINEGEYSNSETYGNYSIHWRSDGNNVYIGITAKTDGWISIAFQPGSRMKDADMIVGLVRDGEAEIQDQYSTGDFGPHEPDSELGGTDDILSFGGKEDDKSTTIEFSRPLDTGDSYDISLTTGINKIIWAYSSSDSLSARHSNRGYGEITISR